MGIMTGHFEAIKKLKRVLFNLFEIEFWPKKGPCGTPHGQTKKFLKNIGKGDIKKGSAKGTEKKWSWMVSLDRPWQDPIRQGHGEWNGNRPLLYPSLSAMPRAHPSWPNSRK